MMHTVDRHGVHIEQCTRCRGIFLDHGELEAIGNAERHFYAPPMAGGRRPDSPPPYRSGGSHGYQDSPRPHRGGYPDSPRPHRGGYQDSPGHYRGQGYGGHGYGGHGDSPPHYGHGKGHGHRRRKSFLEQLFD